MDATTQHLAEQAEQLRREREFRQSLAAPRWNAHLADMREWYRKKLRELARTGGAEPASVLKLHDTNRTLFNRPCRSRNSTPATGNSENFSSRTDWWTANAAALWAEAGRQRRTLRQVLLSSGTITLYQLALIEAGNLDALVLDRFRVIDRLRATPREALYRVFDPPLAPEDRPGQRVRTRFSSGTLRTAK